MTSEGRVDRAIQTCERDIHTLSASEWRDIGVRRLTYIMNTRLQIESLALYSLQTVVLVILPLVERCYTLANQPDLWDCSRFPVNSSSLSKEKARLR